MIFDIAVIGITLLSTLFATMRGFTREFLSVVTWGGSAIIAWYVFVTYPNILDQYIQDDTFADIATIVGTFIISLIVLHLVTMKIADLVLQSAVGPLDRTLGVVFGALRGLLIVAVLYGFMNWLTGPRGFLAGTAIVETQDSITVEYVDRLWESLLTSLPDDWEGSLRDLTDRQSNGLSGFDPNNSTEDQSGQQ